MACVALAAALGTWRPRRGAFGPWLFASVRAAAQDQAREEAAQERLRRELPAPDRGAQERIAGPGQERSGQLAPRLTQGEQQALDLLTVFDGDRGHVCALLGVTKQRLAAIVRQLRGKAIGGVK